MLIARETEFLMQQQVIVVHPHAHMQQPKAQACPEDARVNNFMLEKRLPVMLPWLAQGLPYSIRP